MHFFAHTLDIPAQQNLNHNCDSHDNQGYSVVVRCLRMDDLLYRFDKRSNTGIQDDHGDDHGAQVFDAPITEGMLFIRFLPGQLCSDDRDQRTACIGDVIHRIEHDGDGIGHQSDHRLECGQKHVGDNPDQTGFDDDFFPCLPIYRILFRVDSL